jgi:group I intron endonuclease
MIGIYRIINTINFKVYIGQSWDIEKRFKSHIAGKHNDHLKYSIKKYGIENFSMDCLVVLQSDGDTQKYLDILECLFIDLYNACNPEYGYNKKAGGDGSKPSEETIAKMRAAAIGKKRPKSEEHRRKISETAKGQRLGIEHDEEYRAHQSEAIRLWWAKRKKENPVYKKATAEKREKCSKARKEWWDKKKGIK